MNDIVDAINGVLWGSILIYMLLGAGIIFAVRLRFVQIRHFGHMFSILKLSTKQDSAGISSFQALCTSLAGRVGTGNLAGVAVAISLGGAGAVFWMWMIALLGMATAFAESSLAQLYKERDAEGHYRGGPAYYLRDGLKQPWMAVLFAGCLFFGYGFVFSTVQANSIGIAFSHSYDVSPYLSGTLMMIFAGIIVLGGLRSIASFAEKVVPVMGVVYVAVALYILIININELPAVIYHIVADAFGWTEAGSGMVGAALMNGIKRGLYSNEAGMGSAPVAAAAASPYPPHPVSQGYIQMLGVFFDTIVICTCTAFMILLADPIADHSMGGIQLTQLALTEHLGTWGGDFVAWAILFFGFTSIVANFAYAEANLRFVGCDNRVGRIVFISLFLILILVGTVSAIESVWAMADLSMALMTIVNIIGIVLLSGQVSMLLKDYHAQLQLGKIPRFEQTEHSELDARLTSDVWQSVGVVKK